MMSTWKEKDKYLKHIEGEIGVIMEIKAMSPKIGRGNYRKNMSLGPLLSKVGECI